MFHLHNNTLFELDCMFEDPQGAHMVLVELGASAEADAPRRCNCEVFDFWPFLTLFGGCLGGLGEQ